jgi:hypothetical protein
LQCIAGSVIYYHNAPTLRIDIVPISPGQGDIPGTVERVGHSDYSISQFPSDKVLLDWVSFDFDERHRIVPLDILAVYDGIIRRYLEVEPELPSVSADSTPGSYALLVGP